MKKWMGIALAGTLAVLTGGCARGGQTEAQAQTVEYMEETEDRLPERDPEADRLEQVQESGVLLIGISPDYAPFAFPDETKDGQEAACAGSDVRLGQYIADTLGVEAAFVQMEFDECLEAAGEGTVDMVLLGMLAKTERKKYVDFTDVYYQPGRQVLLVKESERETCKELDDLSGKTVAAQYGTLQAQLITEQLPESYMELTDAVTDSLEMLRSGDADAVALDETVAEHILEEYTELAEAEASFEYEGQGIVGGVVKDQGAFLRAVNAAIGQATEGDLYFDWLASATQQAAKKNQEIDRTELTRQRDRTKTQNQTTTQQSGGTSSPSAQPTDPAAQPTDPVAGTTDPAAQPADPAAGAASPGV
ncbi:MAG: transporter substrate-binding domain-containing protein [Eubacteriales bacterium]|nr:transporter substrate-binding domain-containing protein [Eubacteriales bacterium]